MLEMTLRYCHSLCSYNMHLFKKLCFVLGLFYRHAGVGQWHSRRACPGGGAPLGWAGRKWCRAAGGRVVTGCEAATMQLPLMVLGACVYNLQLNWSATLNEKRKKEISQAPKRFGACEICLGFRSTKIAQKFRLVLVFGACKWQCNHKPCSWGGSNI